MKMYRDSDALTEVTWYWVPDGTPWLDLPNVFYDRTWQLMEGPPSPVGEQLKRPPYYLGRPPVDADATRYCGSPEAWLGMASINDPPLEINPATGLPVCCGPQAQPLIGSVAIGGELVQLPPVSAAGGVGIGGELVQGLGLDGIGIGGELVQGLGLDGIGIGGELVQLEITTACAEVGLATKYWRCNFQGLTAGTCLDCADLGGDWLLTHTGGCQWQSAIRDFCSGQIRLQLQFFSGGVGWRLFMFWIGPTVFTSYGYSGISFDGLGPNDFNLLLGGEECTNWPATVTIVPAGPPG